ncbi:3-hydroxyisobutyrate dehydrogenase [Legionella sp. km772]|uniref:3-hydroxyisobutyrate dehydrogenase n=1 Tax=Legionella sp. km772 TaxID=2498111 RepID=UPI000F8D1ADC|nr:3-hydroxyisobutyrate dehydrogenase [Legionella sp. km772]RUR12884.1 3-hydroxyisobutyrate dehydrogenase [Legionella sp. km772]
MARIGFIGLGHMGFPMAANLVKAGHDIIAYDLQATVLEQFAALGGRIAHQLSEAAIDQEVIITMLQKGQQVLDVCTKPDGLFQHARAGALFIDSSTIDVGSSRQVHEAAQQQGLLAVDAPVSGGVAAATSGTLTFMVGGELKAYEKAEPILSLMGKKLIHTGAAGSGQVAKICNNMILGISMIAVSEAFTLAEQLGLPAQKLFEVANNASGQCWALSKYVPVPGILENVPANNDYKPGFAAAMMLKDLLLSQKAAHQAQLTTPLGAKATELYEDLVEQGLGDADFSAIIKLIAHTIEAQ